MSARDVIKAALLEHLPRVRWDNAATRLDRERFWDERAEAMTIAIMAALITEGADAP